MVLAQVLLVFLKAESYSSITRLKRQYEKMKTNKKGEEIREKQACSQFYISFLWMPGGLDVGLSFLLYYFCCLVLIEKILFGVDALQIC